VDLTPFAGVLSNNQQHTVAVNVFNANGYFSETATLLLYLDHGSTQVTGGVTQNTIGQPDPSIQENLTNITNGVTGSITTTSNRGFTVAGYANTSHGQVTTQVTQSIDFSNVQNYFVTNTSTTLVDNEAIKQLTTISSSVKTTQPGKQLIDSRQMSWPLNLAVAYTQSNVDGSFTQSTNGTQSLSSSKLVQENGKGTYRSFLSDMVTPKDTLSVDAQGVVTTTGQANSEKYSFFDSNNVCWNETIKAAAGVLTSALGGACPQITMR
jgi:hypothetical protein